MVFASKIRVFFYICAFSLYFTWGFTKVSRFYLIFVDPILYAKQIIVAIAFLISILAISYLVPKSISKYTLVGMYCSFGILPWLGLKETNIRRQNLGELLFISQHLSKTIYLTIPIILVSLWSMYRVLQNISDKTTIFSTTKIGAIEINSYLWFSYSLLIVLSVTIYSCLINWNKLEIRDKGIWFISDTVWKKIVDYSWEENKQYDVLIVKQINCYKKEIKNKYAIALGKKEVVNRILRDKLETN